MCLLDDLDGPSHEHKISSWMDVGGADDLWQWSVTHPGNEGANPGGIDLNLEDGS